MGMARLNSVRIVRRVFTYSIRRMSKSAQSVEALFSTLPGEIRGRVRSSNCG